MAFGSAAGLEIVDRLSAEPALASYHLLPSVRGDLLAKARPPRRGPRERKRKLLSIAPPPARLNRRRRSDHAGGRRSP
jgi:predicted RNA polymerase sigma factor